MKYDYEWASLCISVSSGVVVSISVSVINNIMHTAIDSVDDAHVMHVTTFFLAFPFTVFVEHILHAEETIVFIIYSAFYRTFPPTVLV